MAKGAIQVLKGIAKSTSEDFTGLGWIFSMEE